MTYYSIYHKESGALICVGKVLPNPLADDHAWKAYPGIPPHATFWDAETRDYLIPIEIPQEMRTRLQTFVHDDSDAQINMFVGYLKKSRPSLDLERVKLAITRTLAGRLTMDDYALLDNLKELNPGAAMNADARVPQLVSRLELAKRHGKWADAQVVHDQIEALGYAVTYHPDNTITVEQ